MSEKMREGFETWAPIKHSHLLHPFNRIDGCDRYVHSEVQQDWAVWQASRAAVVVELPARVDAKPYACYEGGWNDMHDEAREAIEAQGLKVAP